MGFQIMDATAAGGESEGDDFARPIRARLTPVYTATSVTAPIIPPISEDDLPGYRGGRLET